MLVKIHQGGGDGHSYGTNNVIEKVAEKFHVAVVDVPFLYDDIYHVFPDGSGSNNLHYNDFGYAVFAERLGCSLNTLSAKLNNKNEFTQSDIIKSTRILNINVNDISDYFFAQIV